MLKKLLLALLPGLLLYLGWAGIGISPLLFVAFVPLLLLEKELEPGKPLSWLAYSFAAMLFWWLLGTWWLALEEALALMAVVLMGSLLFTLVLMLFRFIKNKLGAQRGYLALPFLWITAESLLLKGDLAFPWLNLGNALANRVEIIQWYEYLGVMGGSLWVWLTNLCVLGIINYYQQKQLRTGRGLRMIFALAVVIIAPLWVSLQRYYTYQSTGASVNVAVVQPGRENPMEQFLRFPLPPGLQHPDLTIGPEALIKEPLNLDSLRQNEEIQRLQQVTDERPGSAILVGAVTQIFYDGDYSETAGRDSIGRWNDVFNSAVLLSNDQPVKVYHKSRLVAGYERLPFPGLTNPLLGDWLRQEGLKNNGFGRQSEAEVFESRNLRIAPLICWEADFGEYCTRFTRKGANIFSVISNDHWAHKSLAQAQHFHYVRLRAIENRRAVARSTSTGISALINQKGDIMQRIEAGAIAQTSTTLHTNDKLTYYSRAGDVVARVSYFISGFMMLFALVRGYLLRKETKL